MSEFEQRNYEKYDFSGGEEIDRTNPEIREKAKPQIKKGAEDYISRIQDAARKNDGTTDEKKQKEILDARNGGKGRLEGIPEKYNDVEKITPEDFDKLESTDDKLAVITEGHKKPDLTEGSTFKTNFGKNEKLYYKVSLGDSVDPKVGEVIINGTHYTRRGLNGEFFDKDGKRAIIRNGTEVTIGKVRNDKELEGLSNEYSKQYEQVSKMVGLGKLDKNSQKYKEQVAFIGKAIQKGLTQEQINGLLSGKVDEKNPQMRKFVRNLKEEKGEKMHEFIKSFGKIKEGKDKEAQSGGFDKIIKNFTEVMSDDKRKKAGESLYTLFGGGKEKVPEDMKKSVEELNKGMKEKQIRITAMGKAKSGNGYEVFFSKKTKEGGEANFSIKGENVKEIIHQLGEAKHYKESTTK